MRLMYIRTKEGKVKAYFDGLPKFYGEGNTKQEALESLVEKLNAVIAAITRIQEG